MVSTYGIFVLQDWQLNRDGNSLSQPCADGANYSVSRDSQPGSGHGTDI